MYSLSSDSKLLYNSQHKYKIKSFQRNRNDEQQKNTPFCGRFNEMQTDLITREMNEQTSIRERRQEIIALTTRCDIDRTRWEQFSKPPATLIASRMKWIPNETERRMNFFFYHVRLTRFSANWTDATLKPTFHRRKFKITDADGLMWNGLLVRFDPIFRPARAWNSRTFRTRDQ